MNTRARLMLFLGLMVVFSSPALAREEGANASSLAVADAVRSSAVGPTAIYFNPAAMHQFLQYAVETGYQFVHPLDGHVFTAAIADSASNETIAMGISYSYLTGSAMDGKQDRVGHIVRGGIASGYRGKDFSAHLGVGMRYVTLTEGDSDTLKDTTLDVGALVVFKRMLRLAVVGHNLMESEFTDSARRLGLSTSVLLNTLVLSFDSVLDFETVKNSDGKSETEAQYNIGLEYAVMGRMPFRFGYQVDRIRDAQYVSGGVGYVSRVMAVDFGFRQNVEIKNDNIFSLNFRFFVP